jgi:arylsulfatase A-like enzyme
LIITLLANIFFLRIENHLISDKDRLITYRFEDSVLEQNISKLKPIAEDYNVVFIVLESISAKRLGTYGYERNVSPNINKFSEKSIVFDNAYTTATHSDYAQPALLSSRYMLTNDLRNLFNQDSPRKFVWDIFKENGYTTGYYSSQDDNWQHMNWYLNYSNLDNFSYSRTDGIIDYGYGYMQKDMDHKTANLALSWLNSTKDQGKPFFIYINLQSTHKPYTYTEEYSLYKPDTIANNNYDNAMTYVDAQVGRIIAFIAENNLSNNTIIAITADHGEDLENEHNIDGHGNSIYNDELLVPAMVFVPGAKPTRVQEKVSQIDFVPTLIDLLGYRIPPEFQGEVMKKDRPIFMVSQSNKYLIGMISGDIKVIADMNRKLVEVYNITADPNELHSLNSDDYQEDILRLLFWQYCQKNYYSNEVWNNFQSDRCTSANNFKI